jgi:hypothetical protein
MIMPFKTRFFASVASRALTPKTCVTARAEILDAKTEYDRDDRSAGFGSSRRGLPSTPAGAGHSQPAPTSVAEN